MFKNSARMQAGLRPSPTADSRKATRALVSLDCPVWDTLWPPNKLVVSPLSSQQGQ